MHISKVPLTVTMETSISSKPVRSLFKTDAISILLHKYHVDIGILVETWLKEELPYASVAIEGCNVIRKDRDGQSGGAWRASVLLSVRTPPTGFDSDGCSLLTNM